MHENDGCECQDELESVKEEGEKYEGYKMKVRTYGDDYANNSKFKSTFTN